MPKLERRESKNKEMETRNKSGEFRSVGDDGVFEGYLTVWDTVDDYNSEFQRGAFKKTIEERGSKVKIMYDHEHLVGSSIELREDDHGLFGRGKLNLKVRKAQEAFEFMKDGTLEGLSFGFRTIKDKFVGSVRNIVEAQLYEFGPVIFPANEDAIITDVRSQNFSETMDDQLLQEKKGVLMNSLYMTLSDVWWADDSTSENIAGKIDSALSDFHGAYLEFVAEWVARYWTDSEFRGSPFDNELSASMTKMMMESRKTIEDLAGETKFTIAELNELRKGNLITENRENLSSISEEVAENHREARNTAVETLCSELRAGFTNSEKQRVLALLKPVEIRQSESAEDTDLDEMLTYFKNEQITGENDA
jgi:HK97 family phage prohead protease